MNEPEKMQWMYNSFVEIVPKLAKSADVSPTEVMCSMAAYLARSCSSLGSLKATRKMIDEVFDNRAKEIIKTSN